MATLNALTLGFNIIIGKLSIFNRPYIQQNSELKEKGSYSYTKRIRYLLCSLPPSISSLFDRIYKPKGNPFVE